MRHCVPLLTVLIAPGVVAAQTAPTASAPAQAVQAFWDAFATQNWREAARLLFLPDLELRRNRALRQSRDPRTQRTPTVEELMRLDPDVPRAVAEYQVARNERLVAEHRRSPFSDFPGIDSAAQLERLPLQELAESWLRGGDPREQFKSSMKSLDCDPPPEYLLMVDSIYRAREVIVLGAVPTDSAEAFVLFRDPWRFADTGALASLPTVVRLQRVRNEWRIRPLQGLLTSRGLALSIEHCRRPR